MSGIRYLVILIFLIILLFPLYWMFKGSLENMKGMIRMPPTFIPLKPSLKSFRQLLQWDPANDTLQPSNIVWPIRWALNTASILSIKLALVLTTCMMAAYAFSMYEFRFKKALFTIFISSIVLPPMMLVPAFVNINRLGLYGTHWGMILPGAYNSAIMYIMKNYIDTIPRAMIDSARLDGAGEVRILFQIALPLCKPAVGVGIVISTMDTLRDYIWGLMILPRRSQYTLMVGTMDLVQQAQSGPWGNPVGLTLAGGVINFLPLFLAFVLAQRYFIRGMQIGGVKE